MNAVPFASMGSDTLWQPWAVMWLLSVSVYGALKWLSWRPVAMRMSAGASAGYLLAWPGMDPSAFVFPSGAARRESWSCWIFAWSKVAFGAVLVWGVVPLLPSERPLLVGWVGMIGLIFLLHFGTFHLLALLWRSTGREVQPIMDAPWRSTSLSEFWSRRWNLAFRDVAHRLILRPWLKRLGPVGAMFGVFGFSGVVHDLVISLPAGAGYGRPTLYFLLQGAGVWLQRSRFARTAGFDQGVKGWLTTALLLVLPLGLLFHPPFVARVIVPFLDVIGGF